jgi:hypothetical protein
MHWFLHVFGLDSGTGPPYLFWSGIGSDLTELGLIGVLIGAYRKHNCHVRRCWRLARTPVTGTPYVTCRRHNPLIPNAAPTMAEVKEMADYRG